MSRIIQWILTLSIAILGIAYISLYLWFKLNANQALSQEQKDWLKSEIANTPPLPENIYATLEKYYPDFYSESTWTYKVKKTLGFDAEKSQCNEIYMPFVPPGDKQHRKKIPWVPFGQDDVFVKMFIEEHFSQKECFTFHMNFSESFGTNTRGIRKAAKEYFNKELSELNEREVIGLYVMQVAPTTYHPIYNTENHNKAVSAVINRLK